MAHDDHHHDDAKRGLREPDSTTRSLNRRVVLKASAGLAVLATAGIAVVPPGAERAVGQEVGGTRAREWTPDQQAGVFAAASTGEWVTFGADYDFFALGASWEGGVGTWPIVELQLSADGITWSDTISLAAQTDDGGQPTRDGRLFSPLAFTGAVRYVRYRTVDNAGAPGEVAGLRFVYIDPSDGPWDDDISASGELTTASTDPLAPTEVVTRADWGADERWRFDTFGEIWPPEYRTVTHIIIHHTATANRPLDVAGAIRAIYYHHAVSQGWGDIGYNHLVDHNGRIYQGRFGGQNVIGGHAYQFAIGSSGIATIGKFDTEDVTDAAKAGLVAITAFVGRALDPRGSAALQEVPNLPVISSHRDVNAETCPGDRLWNDLPELRELVAATLDSGSLDTGNPAGIAVGDLVRVQTDDGSSLNFRFSPEGEIVGTIENGATAAVIDGPDRRATDNWYRIISHRGSGWAVARYLIVSPPPPSPVDADDYPFGLNVRFTAETNVRSGPTTSGGILRTVARNVWGAILAGPTVADNNEWYQIRTDSGPDGWVIKENLANAPVNLAPAARFQVGEAVEATQQVNIRPRPGIPQRVIATAPAGSRFTISQAAYGVTDFIWYGVFSDAAGGGWLVENALTAAVTTPPPAPARFAVNDTVQAIESLNLRTAASTSASRIATLAPGTMATVVGGPTSASGYSWWQIRTSVGTGWAVENWLTKATTAPPPPASGKFVVNDTVRVTGNLSLRTAASTLGSRIATLAPGTMATVLGGPTSASGYSWWQIRASVGTGWAVENWLTRTTATTPPPSGLPAGTTVQVVEGALNLRDGASTGNRVLAVLPQGTRLSIVSGPQPGSGYSWYQVRSGTYGTGWVVSAFIRQV